MAVDKKDEEEQFMLGTELRDAIAKIIVRSQPNIQWKNLARLVNEFEVELDNLYNIEQGTK